MKQNLPSNTKDIMLFQGALIIFGPTYIDTAFDMQKIYPDQLLLCCERIDDIDIPKTLMISCSLIFSHYLPACKRRKVTKDDLQLWNNQFLSGIDLQPKLSDGSNDPQLKILELSGGDTGNKLMLLISWTDIKSDFCIRVAKELERSYEANNGYY